MFVRTVQFWHATIRASLKIKVAHYPDLLMRGYSGHSVSGPRNDKSPRRQQFKRQVERMIQVPESG